MKKFILLFLCLFTFFTPPINKVSADSGEYARVITEDTPFYVNLIDDTPLFYLPYTYYVKIISYADGFYHVSCYDSVGLTALDGYVPKDYLFFEEVDVPSPYVDLKLTTNDTAVLYSDCNLSSPLLYLFPGRQLTYYGRLNLDGETLLFVGYNDKLGYVKEQNVLPFLIPNHPNPLTFLPEEKPNQSSNEKHITSDEKALKIAIFACLILAGIIALSVALGKNKSKIYQSDDVTFNDYE